VGNAFHHPDLHKVVGEQLKGPAGVAGGRSGAGERGDPGLDLAGDLDLARGLLALLVLQRAERADFATPLAQANQGAGAHAGDRKNISVPHRRPATSLIGKQ
jgi:hypothetical protein